MSPSPHPPHAASGWDLEPAPPRQGGCEPESEGRKFHGFPPIAWVRSAVGRFADRPGCPPTGDPLEESLRTTGRSSGRFGDRTPLGDSTTALGVRESGQSIVAPALTETRRSQRRHLSSVASRSFSAALIVVLLAVLLVMGSRGTASQGGVLSHDSLLPHPTSSDTQMVRTSSKGDLRSSTAQEPSRASAGARAPGKKANPASHTTMDSSAGSLTTPPGYSPSQLIWQDSFAGTRLNGSRWNTLMRSVGSQGRPWNSSRVNGIRYSALSPPDSLNEEVESPRLVTVHNGLSLRAVPGSPVQGYTYTGSVVDTYGKFAWSRGYFQARVKMPDTSSGYWPAIWFLPAAGSGTGDDQGEFDLQEGGTLGQGLTNDIVQSTLHVGTDSLPQRTDVGVNLASGFHTYGARYVPGRSLTVYFDGRQVAQFTQGVPTWPLQLIMCLAVASSQTSPLHTVGSPPASAMQVSEIQFYR